MTHNFAYKRLLKLTQCTRQQNGYLHALNSTQTLIAQLRTEMGFKIVKKLSEKQYIKTRFKENQQNKFDEDHGLQYRLQKITEAYRMYQTTERLLACF